MKNYAIILLCLLLLQNCSSQQTRDIEFIYQRSFFKNENLIESFYYNSKVGIYKYQLTNAGYNPITKNIEITLSKEAKNEIYSLYVKLKPNNLNNCMFENGKMSYTSSIKFTNVNQSNSYNNQINDEIKYKMIEDKLYNFLSLSPLYQKAFPQEFIKK